MNYLLVLKSEEPCDIFLIGESNGLYAIVVESKTAYGVVLDNAAHPNFILLCGKHSFAHQVLDVVVVDDFALIDGSACYTVQELSIAAKEVYAREISGS